MPSHTHVGGVTSEAASQTSPKGFSLADIFKPFQLPISKVSSSDVLKALGKFLPVIYQKGITSNQTLNCPACPTCPEAPYHIGDFAQGGVIIYLTHDGMHGLVAAIDDASSGIVWESPAPYTNPKAFYNDPLPFSTPSKPYGQYYGGYKNQNNIPAISNNLSRFPAFQIAANYEKTFDGVKYDDWWLPSTRELSLMYALVEVINQVSKTHQGTEININNPNVRYWSSREYESGSNSAWFLSFGTTFNGYQYYNTKSFTYAVRCVRAF